MKKEAPSEIPFKCMLLVEDSQDTQRIIKQALEMKGYIVFIAENGKEALAKLSILSDLQRPCLILCDLNMPVMDGWAFIEAVGKENKVVSIPIVIHSSEKNGPEGFETLRKPANLDELIRIAEKHCGPVISKPTVAVCN